MLGHRNGLINLLLLCASLCTVKLIWANPTGPDPKFTEVSGSSNNLLDLAPAF